MYTERYTSVIFSMFFVWMALTGLVFGTREIWRRAPVVCSAFFVIWVISFFQKEIYSKKKFTSCRFISKFNDDIGYKKLISKYIFGFIVSPLIAPVFLAIVWSLPGYRFQPLFGLQPFGFWLMVVIHSYLALAVIGLPLHFLLLVIEKERNWLYFIFGGITGYLIPLFWQEGRPLKQPLPFFLAGGLSAYCWWYIVKESAQQGAQPDAGTGRKLTP